MKAGDRDGLRSLLIDSAALRLIAALGLIALLWLGVAWALAG